MNGTTVPVRGPTAQRDDEPVVELVLEVEALEDVAVELQADASLFGEGASAYESGVRDTVEAIRELAQRQPPEDAQP